MHYNFDQMITFAERRKKAVDKHGLIINTTMIKSRPRVIDYSTISYHPPLQLFVSININDEMIYRLLNLISEIHINEKICQQFINKIHYPLICGKL